MGCKIFSVGVFFDGTGNNKERDGEAQSNIAKLSSLYFVGERSTNDVITTCAMVYKNGVGTYDSWWEHHSNTIDRKYDKGGGGGGAKRINEAIEEVKKLLVKHPYGVGEDDYKERKIDVFGFSRGAAMARDFINTFNNINNKTWKIKNFSFNFVGLYDTVGSFGRPGNDKDFKPLDQSNDSESDMKLSHALNGDYGMLEGEGERYNFHLSDEQAKKIVHMTAHNEVRKNFPLMNSKGAGSAYSFIGVHSDIGGGYPKSKSEKHQILLKVFKGSKGLGNLLHNQKDIARKYGKAELLKLQEKNILSAHWHVDIETETHWGYEVDEYKVYLKAKRIVNNDLAVVTLYMMHNEAYKEHVPFTLLQDEIPNSMKLYYKEIKTTPSSAYDYAKKSDGLKIKRDYVHHSAVDPAGLFTNYFGDTGVLDIIFDDSADGEGNDARYLDKNGEQVDGRKNPDLAVKVERAIYQNIPSEAIV